MRPFVTSGSRGWASFYSYYGALFVRITNLSRESIYLDLSDSKFVTLPLESSEGIRTRLCQHDVLISITADIGMVGYVDASMPTPAYINQHIALVRFDQDRTCGKFISYFLASERSQKLFRAATDTGAKAGMSLPVVLKIHTALPPLTEQRAIAAALSDVDALLNGLDRLIAKKRDLKQAAMQQLLTGQTRLPGFGGEWEVKRLGNHLEFLSNGTNSRAELIHDGWVRYLHYGDIHSARGLLLNPAVIAMPFLPEAKAERLDRLRDGDLIFADASEDLDGVGKSIELQHVGDLQVVSGMHTIAVRFDKKVLADGFKTYLQMIPTFRNHLRRLVAGTKVYATNMAHIASAEVHLPGTAEQTAIAAVLSDMDAELAALEAHRDKTHALKQAMMQELLTGKTRLVPSASNVVPVDFRAGSKVVAVAQPDTKSHNWAINEAVVISVLVKQFGSEQYPLGRKRCTKLSYLMHRHVEHVAMGYLKKAAGPYNPSVKYKGPEGIAQKNGYIRTRVSGKFSGFVAAANISKAQDYFDKWYGADVLSWLEQFRFKSNDELELLATVDMSVEDLRRTRAAVNLDAVKSVIRANPEWEAKLERPIFSDANITRAIGLVRELFPIEG